MIDELKPKSGMPLLDYEREETWRNYPAPEIDPRIQQDLAAIGGLIPPGFGNFSGKPNFIIVWGQEYHTFLNGKMRLMFDDKFLDANHYPNHFTVAEAVYHRALDWLKAEEQKRLDAFLNLDWKTFQQFPDCAEYLELHESSLDYRKLPGDASPRAIARLMPPGWRYLPGQWTYEEIGEQFFYVLQWLGPRELGAESDWTTLRFAKSYFPETDREEFLDVIGEYPHHGQYCHPVLRIADKVAPDVYAYREPTVENVIPALQELLRIRDRLSDREKQSAARTAKRFENFRAGKQIEKPGFRSEFNYIFNQAKPVGKGEPTSLPTVKVRDGINKHGKGEKIDL